MPVTEADVTNYVGQGMADICSNHYDTEAQNHCAHFVAHALGIHLGVVCGDLAASASARHTGATVRCNELFNGLPRRGAWADRPAGASPILVFVTFQQNVTGNVMGQMPSKHVGVWFTQRVYNFSNTEHRVRFDASPDAFFTRMSDYYSSVHPNLGALALYFAVPTV